MTATSVHISAIVAAMALLATTSGDAQAERGRDGTLKILYWQAVSILNPFLSAGHKDVHAASLVIEPLARYDEDGVLVPWLATEIPTLENGGINDDLTRITWHLKPDLLWSDGTAFTADDVVFTADYCMSPEGGCQQLTKFVDVDRVEALDPLTVQVSFKKPKPFPYGPFVGMESPVIQKAQFKDCMGENAPNCTAQNFAPHGTGPFRVTEFRANDVVLFEANPHYRAPDKPRFASVEFKGGGTAVDAARAVLETGEFDYGWNLQVDPSILNQMQAAGKGQVVTAYSNAIERLVLNLTNPAPELGAKRSTRAAGPHPFLSDPVVRQALSLAIDRTLLAEVGYGSGGQATCNVVAAPDYNRSDANDGCLQPDIARANQILDAAGWEPGADGVRVKDGVRLSILFQTSTSAVRQDTQAMIKAWWREIGVETELKHIEPSVYFGGDPSSPDTTQKFYADIQMFTNLFPGTDAETYMNNWTCAKIPSPDNNWLGFNMSRHCDPDYDALAAKLASTSGTKARGALVKRMNDMLIRNGAIIPLINRGSPIGHANTLANVRLNAWDSDLWNIADWARAQ